MMKIEDLVESISLLQRSVLERWIKEELVVPREEAGTILFTETDCARVRLLCTLHYELEIEEETLPLLLSVVDQLYEYRHRLLTLAGAVATQEKHVQDAIVTAMRSRSQFKISADILSNN
jgi:chaperone modulatory protein CbpM